MEEAIHSRLAAQIEAIRIERGWDYKRFAQELNKKVAWAYRLEDPNEAVPTIPSLLEVAEALDVGLDVRFRPFSELLDDVVGLENRSFEVPSFAAELKSGALMTPKRRTAKRLGRKMPRGRSARRTKHPRLKLSRQSELPKP